MHLFPPHLPRAKALRQLYVSQGLWSLIKHTASQAHAPLPGTPTWLQLASLCWHFLKKCKRRMLLSAPLPQPLLLLQVNGWQEEAGLIYL